MPGPNLCTFYEHFDYKGKSVSLHAGHVLAANSGTSVSKAFAGGKRFDAPEWGSTMSSLKLSKNCQAVVSNGKPNGKEGGEVTITTDLPKFDGNYNDKVSFVGCSCK